MAGARRVYEVEQGPIIAAAKLICKQNGFQDRVTLINDWSDKIELPEKVDVIITEIVGNLAFEEGILGWITDFKKRFLGKGGQIIPRMLELVIVTVESAEYDD
jgi:predicted RNA methylase